MTEMFGEAWSPMSVPDLAPDDDDDITCESWCIPSGCEKRSQRAACLFYKGSHHGALVLLTPFIILEAVKGGGGGGGG